MRSLLLAAIVAPTLAYAQEAPSGPPAEPASQASSLPASAPASSPSSGALLPEAPSKETFKRYPSLAYKLSLYPTLAGFGGYVVFGTARFLTENNAFRPIAYSSLALGLVGPSIGYFYSGENFRGVRLLARRVAVPGVLALAGTGILLASAGGSVVTAINSAVDDTGEGASRAALLGMMVGGAMISYSVPSISIMSGRHVRGAKRSPLREAKRKKLAPPPETRPAKN